MANRMANPERASRGGDVTGDTRIDVTMGEALPVASASFDPGYDLDTSMEGGDKRQKFSKADLVQGYCSYGINIGE